MSTKRTITTVGSGPLQNPDGTALASQVVTFTLVDINGIPLYGFETVDGEGIFDKAEATTDSNGDFSIDLYPNDEITGDTYYQVDLPGVDGYDKFQAKLAAGVGSVFFKDFYASGAVLTPDEVSTLTAHIQDNEIHSPPSIGAFVNLKAQTNDTNPTYQADITADNLTLSDINGLPLQASSASVTADITATGANGRDSSVAEKVSEHYALYVIGKADGTISSLIKQWTETGTADGTTANKLIDSGASFSTDGLVEIGDTVYNFTAGVLTTVTAIDSDSTLSLADDIFTSGDDYRVVLGREPTLPTGYTFRRRVGSVYNKSSGHFRAFRQAGWKVWLLTNENFLVAGSATSYTLIIPEVPPSAASVNIRTNATGGSPNLSLSLDGASAHTILTGRSGLYYVGEVGLSDTQQIYYKIGGSGVGYLSLYGFDDNL